MKLLVELGHGLRLQFQLANRAATGFDHQLVIDEVELDLE